MGHMMAPGRRKALAGLRPGQPGSAPCPAQPSGRAAGAGNTSQPRASETLPTVLSRCLPYQGGGGLVEDEEPGARQQSARNGQPLPLPAAQLHAAARANHSLRGVTQDSGWSAKPASLGLHPGSWHEQHGSRVHV